MYLVAKLRFVIGLFCSHHLFVSAVASDMIGLYGYDVFSILVLSTKKRYPSSL